MKKKQVSVTFLIKMVGPKNMDEKQGSIGYYVWVGVRKQANYKKVP